MKLIARILQAEKVNDLKNPKYRISELRDVQMTIGALYARPQHSPDTHLNTQTGLC